MGISGSKAISAMAYGGFREKTSAMIAPYTRMIPLGSISDEVGMLALSVAAKKYFFKKAGLGRDIIKQGQTIELARIGEALMNGEVKIPFLNSSVTTPTTSTAGNIF